MLQRHVSYHWTTSQKLESKNEALVLVPGKGPCLENLPCGRNKFCSANQFWSGVKEGEDSRTTSRKGGCFGSGPDELGFQTRQPGPLRENDLLEVVLGRSPKFQGK